MPHPPRVSTDRSGRRAVALALLVAALSLGGLAAQERRVVGVDENGWPVFAPPGEVAPAPVPERASPPAVAAPAPVAAASRAPESGLDSPLQAVWARVGPPANFAALRGIALSCSLRVHDADGGEIARREFVHEAELGHPARDRLQFLDGRTLGRDGGIAFQSRSGIALPLGDAGEEVALHGLLLRAPWCLASGFELVERRTSPGANDRVVLHFVGTPPDDAAGGFRPELRLVCAADTMQPLELRYTMRPGTHRRMTFGDWRRVGDVWLPFRRAWLAGDGRVAMELEVLGIEHGLALPTGQFQRR